jgi:hypothetical protein
MANLNGFDASQVPEQQDFSALPEGQYVVIATASETKATKNGTGEYLQFTLEVLDGPFKGRKLWDRLNLWNPNQTAVDIANRQLAAMCRAVGVIKPADSAELHNKPLLATVAVEIDDRKREGNVIKKYEALSGGTVSAPVASPSAVAAPWGGAAQRAPVASGPVNAPWQK